MVLGDLMDIVIEPVPCTLSLMERLETLGVIRLLSPGRDLLDVGMSESSHKTMYSADEKFGPHKLICVTINSTKPTNFLYHSDTEDFMLIDRPGTADLILTVSLIDYKDLNRKIGDGSLSTEDFVSIRCNKNDPYTSFFSMNKYFPHVETVLESSDNPPSFYVGESRDLDENIINFKNYSLVIKERV